MSWNGWQCPCPECNGRLPTAPDEREDWFEPEHPENVSPEREGYDTGLRMGWGVYAARRAMSFECERAKGADEVDLRDAGRPTHYRCRGCLDTFPVIGDTDTWKCPSPWWRDEAEGEEACVS